MEATRNGVGYVTRFLDERLPAVLRGDSGFFSSHRDFAIEKELVLA